MLYRFAMHVRDIVVWLGTCFALLTLGQAIKADAQVYNPPDTTAMSQRLGQLEQQASIAAMVQQSDVTLNAQGDGTWTFSPAFPVVPAVVHLPKAVDALNPIICNYMSVTTTSVSVHCWRTNVTGLLSGLLGGSINGAQVKLIARAIP